MSDLFDRFIEFTAQFILLDWGALIGLIPIGIGVVVVLWLVLTIRKFATAGPTRRGKRRITPQPPSGVHLPGPSYSPIFGAIGTGLFLLGLVFGGALLVAGVIILVLSLLYWGYEALNDYDRAVHTERALVVVDHGEPPPGVHLPGPSFRPILASLALTVLFFGLVFGGWILAVGVLATIVTLLGWLRDARREYTNVVVADRTGHLENLGTPSWPRRLVTIFAILVIGALVVDLGVLPPRSDSAVGGEGPGASGEPEGPVGSGTSAPPPEGDVVLIAKDSKFDKPELPVPAGAAFTIGFVNEDGGVDHDVAIVGDSGLLYDGENITGPASITYDVPALDAGSYQFLCTIHPTMTGTLTAGG
jgi:plastocyanin